MNEQEICLQKQADAELARQEEIEETQIAEEELMQVKEKIHSLNKQLTTKFKKNDLGGVCNILEENIGFIFDWTKAFIPDKAVRELYAKKLCNWPSHSGLYYGDKDSEMKRKFSEKRWGEEKALLDARHPKRIEKLWEPIKNKLEKRYNRTFEGRADLASMSGIFNIRNELSEQIIDLKQNIEIENEFKIKNKEEPNYGWGKVAKFWRDYVVSSQASGTASSLLDLMIDLSYPHKIIDRALWKENYEKRLEKYYDDDLEDEEEEDPSLLGGDISFEFPVKKCLEDRFNNFSPWQIRKYSEYIVKNEKGNITFAEALMFFHPDEAKAAGLKIPKFRFWGWGHQIPLPIKKIAYKTLKKLYNERIPNDEASTFMNWYSKIILKRWKATAIDHERLFDYHKPHFIDARLMSIFWGIRNGKEYNQYSRIHNEKRLPGLLRAMVKDGVLKSADVDPPLKKHYLTPDEVLNVSTGKNRSGGKLEALVNLKMLQEPLVIATRPDYKKMLPGNIESEVVKLDTDLSPLGDVLDSSKQYEVLYKGSYVLFLMSQKTFPTGSRSIGDIHRLTLIPENAEPKQGQVITLNGKRFNITRLKSLLDKDQIRGEIYDSNADAVPISTYTSIIDISPEEFKEKYFKDFIAHVLIHRPSLTLEDLVRDLEKIEKLPAVGLNFVMGPTGRTRFRTFDFGGRFGFQIKNEKYAMTGEVPFISKTLMEYIRDVGLPVHNEINLDEHGRRVVEQKKLDREFYEENFNQMVQTLSGDGLIKTLSFILRDKNYSVRDFGIQINPCDVCGEKYVTGTVFCPKRKETSQEGFDTKDLHELSRHPNSFRFEWGNLRKIYDLLKEVKDYQPLFIKYPEIINKFRVFGRFHQEHIEASSACYNFWEGTMGGVDAEQEELEDNPKLRKLREKEIRLNQAEHDTQLKMYDAAIELQKKYNLLRGQKTPEIIDAVKVVSNWAQELMLLSLYQAEAPKLLTGQKQSLLEDRIEFHLIS